MDPSICADCGESLDDTAIDCFASYWDATAKSYVADPERERVHERCLGMGRTGDVMRRRVDDPMFTTFDE